MSVWLRRPMTSDRYPIEDLDGLPWTDRPRPWRLHRCRPVTRVAVGGKRGPMERCACGALRYWRKGWLHRNSRDRVARALGVPL